MKTNIILNDGSNNCCKSINRYLIENLKENFDIVFNKCHGKLLHLQQTLKPKLILWSASEYTQEFHDYITDYHDQASIILIVDVKIDNDQLVNFLNQTQIKIIQNSRYESGLKNIIAKYDHLYEDAIFNNTDETRNDKILAILSHDNEVNQKLNDFIYPVYTGKEKVVALGNPQFKAGVNLGIFNAPDLAFILNRFSAVLDLSEKYRLEAQACNIPYLNTDNIADAIENKTEIPKVPNLSELTYKNFVYNTLLPYIRSKI